MNISLSIEDIKSVLIQYGFNIYMYNGIEYAQKDTINLPVIKAFREHLKIKLSVIQVKITVSPTEPMNPSIGDLWIQTN